jgi:large subunit ribosomal protein L4e
MELKIISTDGKETGKVKLPSQFAEPLRQGLISRVALALQSHIRQPYGADPRAGKKASARLSRRRRKYKGAYGKGISRVPRKTMLRRGTQFQWVGAFAPGTVGGRRAHPPVVEKILAQKINDKERKKALRSALAATVSADAVKARGHDAPAGYPFVADNKFEEMKETGKVEEILNKLGFGNELERTSERKIRAGKGKSRGRKYKSKKGILIVVSGKCNLALSAKNIPGIDVAEARNLNVNLLAPGGMPGRLTLFTQGAIEKIDKEKLFAK